MTIGWLGKRRESRERSNRPVRALILGGGGARGAYEAGVVAALSERESFDIVCGTSIGAVNGMFVAQDMPDRLVEIWSAISTRGVTQLKPELAVLVLLWQAGYGLIQSPFSKKASHALTMLRALPQLSLAGGLPHLLGMFEGGNVRGVIKELADLDAVRRTFIVGVTNLTSGRGESFAYFPPEQRERELAYHAAERSEPIHAANYVEAICASAALPPVYEPVRIMCGDRETRLFADGGFTNNAPFQQAIDAGATDITAIFVTPPGSRASARGDAAPASVMDIMSTMLEANTERMLELDLKLARRINVDVAAGMAPGKRHVNFRIISPNTLLRLPTLGFDDQVEVDRLFALGYADGSDVRAA